MLQKFTMQPGAGLIEELKFRILYFSNFDHIGPVSSKVREESEHVICTCIRTMAYMIEDVDSTHAHTNKGQSTRMHAVKHYTARSTPHKGTHTHTHTHTHIHIHIHTYTYTHAHTNTHAHTVLTRPTPRHRDRTSAV
jgi:hypothetical protein